MKYLVLVLKSARRSKRWTALTVLSVAIAVFLLASLPGVHEGFDAATEASSSTRVVTERSTSLYFAMPTSHGEAFRNAPGVQDVTGAKKAFLADRTGCIVGEGLPRTYGCRTGDRITLQVGIPNYGTRDFDFTIRGTYRPEGAAVDNQSMVFHWKYADERSTGKGHGGWDISQISNPDQATQVAGAIDRKAVSVRSANVAIGVGSRIVLAFIRESTMLALVGGVVGCVIALPVHGLSTGTTNFSSFSEVAFKFRITPLLLAGGLAFAALTGAAGGLLPALRAARIPVARALRET
jgi:ABC-type lipoprotein release transport system permease subunit